MPVDKGTYNASTTYEKLDMVHTSDSTYVSKVDNNVGHAVTDTNYWACWADGKPATQAASAANSAAEAANAAREAIQTDLAARPTKTELESGDVIPAISGDLESWANQSNLTPYTHEGAADTAGGSASIMSDIAAPFEELLPASRLAKATKIVATGKNLLRLVSNGGIATSIGTGFYFPCPELKFGTYGVADENNGVIFTTASGVIAPTVRMKAIEDGVPTSVNDGVAAATVSGTNGETFYVNPASLSGKAVYVIVSGITQASTCAHIAWSGTGTAYNFYCSPTDASDAGSSIDLSASLTAIGNNGYLTLVGGKADSISRNSATQLKTTKRNARVQPSWNTEADPDNTGQYIHTAVIADMMSGGAAILESDGTLLTVSDTTVRYVDNSSSATSSYVLYNLASEAFATQNVTSTNLDIDDFGLIVLLGAEGSLALTVKYAVGIKDTLRQIASSDFTAVQNELGALADEVGRQGYQIPFEADFDHMPTLGGQPGLLFCDGAPTAANKPTNWVDFLNGGYNWTGLPNVEGQHVLDYTNHIDYYGWRNPETGLLEWKY